MQAYSSAFARIYNERWVEHARHVAPILRAFYESTALGAENRHLLDLCCGTGQLAVHFLEHGYTVTGFDFSEPMLRYACKNAAPYVAGGQARFVQGDASDFALDERYGLVVSTFDVLNHLPDEAALRACFACVYRVLEPGGVLVLADSIQLADSPQFSVAMENFRRAFHEPYYPDYIRDDIDARLSAAGFQGITAESHFMARVWAAQKTP